MTDCTEREWLSEAIERILEIPSHWREKREEVSIELFAAYERGKAEERELLDLYREAVIPDVQMGGPQFMGCNGSALKRAYLEDRKRNQP